MKMNNCLKALFSLVLLAFLGSCSSEEEKRVLQDKDVLWSICRPTCLTAVR